MADKSLSEENLSMKSVDLTGEDLTSTCGDMGHKTQEDNSYMLGSYPQVFKQIPQSMTLEQNPPETENMFDEDLCTVGTDSFRIYNLDSILCQFDTFFRQKLNTELQAFQENMHAMFAEQQVHIQRIINSSTEHSLNEAYIQSSDAVTEEPNGNSTKTIELRCNCHDSEIKAKMGLILELLSLSAQITSVLNLPKFS